MPAAIAAVQTRFKNVLFATDFSDAAALAIPYVREIAKHYHANVLTLHVPPARAHSISERSWTSDTQTAEAEEQHRKQIVAAFPDARTSVLIREVNVEDHLDSIIYSRDVDLVVIGTTGQTRDGKHRLGSVAEEIFRRVTCPVLTVGPHSLSSSSAGFRKILCASDQASDQVVAHAVSLSQEFQSRLVLLSVISEQEAGYHVPSSDMVSTSEYYLHNRLPPGAEGCCKPEYIVSYGDIAEKILEVESKTNPDLIVLGARPECGIHGAAANLPITTAQKIVSRATCPVLTVRS